MRARVGGGDGEVAGPGAGRIDFSFSLSCFPFLLLHILLAGGEKEIGMPREPWISGDGCRPERKGKE